MDIYGQLYQTYYTESGNNYTADGDGKISDVPAADMPDLVRQGLVVHDFVSASVVAGGGGFAGFTASLETAEPNDFANASLLQASGGDTDNQDAVIQPKGYGAFSLGLATGDSVGGDKRGQGAVDLQIRLPAKNSTTQVASGFISCIGGGALNTSSDYASVVAGGIGNTASSGAAIVGGGFNNTADGDSTAVLGGGNNSASEQFATVGGGNGNTASGIQSFVGGGTGNTASSDFAVVAGGSGNTADAPGSSVPGGWAARTRGRIGSVAWSVGAVNVNGDTQYSRMLLTAVTLDEVAVALTANHGSASSDNQLMLPDAATYMVRGRILARHDSGDCAAWSMDAMIRRGEGASSTSLIDGSYQQVFAASVNAPGTGGTPGPVTITGTTGTGTPFQATGTIDMDGFLTDPLVISVPGNYTVEPTLSGEDVTGSSLSDATVDLDVEWILEADARFQEAGSSAWAVLIAADRVNGTLLVTGAGDMGKTIIWLADLETLEVVL